MARDSAVPVHKPRAPKAPKEATDDKAPKAAGTSAVAGWAKRMTPGGKPAATDPAPRGYESFGAGAGAAAASGAAAAAAGSAAAAPAAAQVKPAPESSANEKPAQAAGPGPVVSSPATQVASTVPAASATPAAASGPGVSSAAPSAAEQTQAAAVGSPAAEQTQAAAVVPPAAEQTQAAEVPAASDHSAPTTVNPQVRQQEPIGATVDPASRPEERDAQPAYEAFWFAVAQPRTAMDEHSGAAAFVIEPGGWVLALEDRGHEFLVQHTDGRVGVLRDLSNIERG